MHPADGPPPGSPAAGLLLATLAAVLFALGAVLQHEAADLSRTPTGLSLRLLVRRRRWMLGQASTMLGTGSQVAALAVAPVAVVQPMLAAALVVALGGAGDPQQAGPAAAGTPRRRPDHRWPRGVPARRPAGRGASGGAAVVARR